MSSDTPPTTPQQPGSRPGPGSGGGPARGTVLGNRYELTEAIASGGMGDVWKARDSVLGRDVAVKVMRPDSGRDATFAERFRDEARHTASLSHPNIATVYDYGEDGGAAYLVMELVDGEPLSALIARGPMAPSQVRSILGQAALALSAAHDAGVVHRDVKPANIMITPQGRVKLTDFGIARAGDGASYTRTGEVLGTPQYLAPEQALGRVATGASDIYALGIIGWEMLTGRKPFDSGSAVATALAQVNDPPPPLPDTVPDDLARVVMSCLAKDPAARPTSALALAAALGMPVSGLSHVLPATEVVHTGHTDPSATQVIASDPYVGAPTQAYQPYADEPAAYGDGADGPDGYGDGYGDEPKPEPKKRRGIGLWWIPIVVLLAAAAIFTYAWLNPSSRATPDDVVTVTTTATPTTTTTTPTTSITTETPTRTTTTTTAPATVTINASTYIGKSASDAQGILLGLGFAQANIKTQEISGSQAKGTVLAISPTGLVPVTATVTLTVSDGNATPATP